MEETVEHHYADVGEVVLHYLTAGRGEPLVLLHGIPQTSHEWRHVIPFLASRYRIIAPDLRGLGDSSRPADGYDKKTVAEDVWRLLHDHLRLKRFLLAGHDWGGPVAFAIAARHRDAVRALAIIDVVIPGDGAEMSQGGNRWHHPFFRTLDLPEALCAGREELILDWLYENYGHRVNSISAEDRKEYLRTYKKPGAFRAMLGYYRAFGVDAQDNAALLQQSGPLKMPVIALGGSESFGRGMEAVTSVRRMAENVEGEVIPNCGHWVPDEVPEFLAARLARFFDSSAG